MRERSADTQAELLRYMIRKRDHAARHGSAVCESFDLWEMEDFVAALTLYYNIPTGKQCPHDATERADAAVHGQCPLCLTAQLVKLRAAVRPFAEADFENWETTGDCTIPRDAWLTARGTIGECS